MKQILSGFITLLLGEPEEGAAHSWAVIIAEMVSLLYYAGPGRCHCIEQQGTGGRKAGL